MKRNGGRERRGAEEEGREEGREAGVKIKDGGRNQILMGKRF